MEVNDLHSFLHFVQFPELDALRRVRDSNPRYVQYVYRISSAALSTTQTTLLLEIFGSPTYFFFEKRVQRYNKNLNCANNYAFFCTKEAILP